MKWLLYGALFATIFIPTKVVWTVDNIVNQQFESKSEGKSKKEEWEDGGGGMDEKVFSYDPNNIVP